MPRSDPKFLTVDYGPFFDGGNHADSKPIGKFHVGVLTRVTRVVPRQVPVHGRDEAADRLT